MHRGVIGSNPLSSTINKYSMFSIIDKNFLSLEECENIKEKLNSHRDLWQTSNIKSFYFFPLGLYSCFREYYKSNLKTYKILCNDLFGEYYTRLKNILEKTLMISLDYNDKLNFPGFHISNNYGMSEPNFHKDSFINLNEFFNGRDKLYFANPKIISVVVVINTLKENTGLLIREKINNFKFDSNYNYLDLEIEYTRGMLAMWSGETTHSIKPFLPSDSSDIRITMQCHIAIGNKKGYIFW